MRTLRSLHLCQTLQFLSVRYRNYKRLHSTPLTRILSPTAADENTAFFYLYPPPPPNVQTVTERDPKGGKETKSDSAKQPMMEIGNRFYGDVIGRSSMKKKGKKSRNVHVCSNCGEVGTMKRFTTDQKVTGMRSWLPRESTPIKLTDDSNWRIPPPGQFGAQLEMVLGGGLVPGSPSLSTMRSHLRHLTPALCRSYATTYTGKVLSSTNTGRFSAIQVSVSPPTLISDVRGYPLPRRELIVQVTKILQSKSSLDPFLDLSEYLHTLNVPPTSSEVSEILKALKSPTLALELFHFFRSHVPNFRHDAFTYNRILLILSKSSLPSRIDKMKEIIDLMERLRTTGNISTVNILIGAFNSVDELEKCLELLKKWELQMTSYTYKCLLQAYIRADDLNRALQVYGRIRRKGYALDIFGYNMLLHAIAKDEKVDQACEVFEDMKKKHCKPDEYTYTILIRMNGRLGKLNSAVALFEEMLSMNCKPNSMAYNTMIEALVKGRMSDKAMILFSKMVENNCRPNEFTYSLILNVLAAEGQLGRMDEVVEISSKYMNKSIYAFLVRTLSKLGHASEAHRLFCSMWSSHGKGDRDAYLSMLESLCNAGKVTEAIEMLSRTYEKGIIADTFMYNTVFSALGKSKQVVHLLDLYEKMKQDGPPPDIFTFNILISGLGRAGRVEEAIQVFEELENSDCTPDVVSYNSLINCLGKNGDLGEAHMRLKEMQEMGLNPDVVTYSTLIECFGKSGKVEMAYSLFNEMLAEGCCPNIITYNILLDCLEMSGRSVEAVDLYSKLKEQGLTPDKITYSILERLQSGSQRTRRIRKQNPITGWIVSPLR